jgi:hypothetical protein
MMMRTKGNKMQGIKVNNGVAYIQCAECLITMTAEDYAYGHDCEVSDIEE